MSLYVNRMWFYHEPNSDGKSKETKYKTYLNIFVFKFIIYLNLNLYNLFKFIFINTFMFILFIKNIYKEET